MLEVYWEIGKVIIDQELIEGWGGKTVDVLARDLKTEFPSIKGFSPRNLRYMKSFYHSYSNKSILQAYLAKLQDPENEPNMILHTTLAKLSWYHHITILDKVKTIEERIFYIQETIQNGWSRDVMVHQIESNLYRRQGAIINNFNQTILPEQSELVQQIFKDPYKFDFVSLTKEAKERDLEDALTNQLTKFLLELGQWFSFMGRQYRVQLGNNEYFFDLLFYHTRLKRYIIIELKINEFKPEYKGKMEFYLNLADDQLKSTGDEASIGLILCKTKDGLIAEYALRESSKPIGIAEYNLSQALPEDIRGELPSIEELEAEIEREYKKAESPAKRKIEELKKKIALSNSEEIKTALTQSILKTLLQNKLKPLFESLIIELKEIDSLFFESTYSWQGILTCIYNPENLEQGWGDEQLKSIVHQAYFYYNYKGFLKKGTDSFDLLFSIKVDITPFWYALTILGHNNQQPVIKKLYHEDISDNETIEISERTMEFITEEIHRRIE